MECYRIPAAPLPILLPVECVAEVVAKPDVASLEEARANWMHGHATWRNQRLPVISYSALHDASLDESKETKPHLLVLNPVPDAVRKAFAGVIFYGDAETVAVDESASFIDIPEGIDRRYTEAALSFEGQNYLVPRLAALAVAFSYF